MNIFSAFLVLFSNYCFIAVSKDVGSACTEEGRRESLSCESYVECHNGRYSVKYCDFGYKYDYNINDCIPENSFDGPCSSTCSFEGNKPVKGSNSKYVYCKEGKLLFGKCNQYFNRLTRNCKLIESKNNLYYDTNSISFEESNCIPDKRIPVKNSCKEYMECDSIGGWVHRECQDCQHFEPTSMNCVWAWKYYCDYGGSTYLPPTEDSPTTEQPITSTSFGPTGTNDYSTSNIYDPTTDTSSFEPTGTGTTQEPYSTVISSSFDPSTVTSSREEPTSSYQPTTEIPTSVTAEQTTSSNDPYTTTSILTTSTPLATSTIELKTTSTTSKTSSPTSTITKQTTSFRTKTTSTTTKPSSSTRTATTTKVPYECFEEGEKKIFLKGDCKDYLECVSGKWVEKTCWWGFHFDIIKLKCRWNWWATC